MREKKKMIAVLAIAIAIALPWILSACGSEDTGRSADEVEVTELDADAMI